MEIFLGCGAFFCLVEFLLYRRRERKLKELTLYLLKLQDGAELPPFESFEEGQLGVLQSEIYKMVSLLDEETKKSKRQNHYLADMLKLKKETVSAAELVETAVGPLNILAELKGVELEMKIPEGIELSCDRAWTAEALSNVIKNCIEHVSTDAGKHVWITVAENNFAVTLTVRDDGPGIPPEELPHIFERFYKGKNSSKNSVGIGLAMARQIFLQQNGTIEAASEPGKGTSFRIRFYTGVSL